MAHRSSAVAPRPVFFEPHAGKHSGHGMRRRLPALVFRPRLIYPSGKLCESKGRASVLQNRKHARTPHAIVGQIGMDSPSSARSRHAEITDTRPRLNHAPARG